MSMNEQEPAGGSPHPAHPSVMQVPADSQAPRLSELERKTRVLIGGFLAGLGLSLAAVFVMRVVQEASPNAAGISIAGNVIAVIFVAGPVFGLGLSLALVALIPSASTAGSSSDANPAPPDAAAHQVPDSG